MLVVNDGGDNMFLMESLGGSSNCGIVCCSELDSMHGNGDKGLAGSDAMPAMGASADGRGRLRKHVFFSA